MFRTMRGVQIRHSKYTKNNSSVDFPLPDEDFIPMSQSMGAHCEPIVDKGDTVTLGQKIGESEAFMSAPIHSSVSGVVESITDYLLPDGKKCKAILIKSDGEQTICSDVKPPDVTDKASLITAIRESGLVGLGGAGFPTHVKLGYDPVKTPINMLIINAAECEPYITSDFREIAEHPNDILEGILLLQRLLGIPHCKVCIEENNHEAVSIMRNKMEFVNSVEVVALPTSYPQGAEKVIIYSATGRIVKDGELPAHRGVLTLNVSTLSFINKYCATGMPLVTRRVTFDGPAVSQNAGNYIVPIGTRISELLKHGQAENAKKIIYGGPMMGLCLCDRSQPILKTTNAVIACLKAQMPKTTPCIRCGLCIEHCPMKLMPVSIQKAYIKRDVKTLKDLKVNLCFNCGCCTYVCPGHRRLAENTQLAKQLIVNG